MHLDLMRTVALKVLDGERLGVEAERRFKVGAPLRQLEHEEPEIKKVRVRCSPRRPPLLCHGF